MLTRRTVILAEREATYGTDPAMTGTDGILAFDVDINIVGEVLKRDVMRDTLSQLPGVVGMKEVELTFKTEIKGNGLSGTGTAVPELDPLLHGCGFATAAITGTDLSYVLQSAESSMGSTALKVYKDGNLHKITGSRGTVKAMLEAGKYGVLEFSFKGLYNAVIASTIPDLSGLSANKPPVVYNASFVIDTFSPVCSKMEIDLANGVARNDDINATYGVNSFRIASREPKASFTADAVVESSNPFWGDWSGDVVNPYSVTVGATAGNKVRLSGFMQTETNKYADADGISKYEVAAALVSSTPDTQNDELVIKFA